MGAAAARRVEGLRGDRGATATSGGACAAAAARRWGPRSLGPARPSRDRARSWENMSAAAAGEPAAGRRLSDPSVGAKAARQLH